MYLFTTSMTIAVASLLAMADEPPPELSIGPLTQGDLVISTDTKTVLLEYGTHVKEIEIYRTEREDVDAEWSGKLQVLTTSFFILDARMVCDDKIYVTGVYRKLPTDIMGETTIEVWTFTHPRSHDKDDEYIPLRERRNPTVNRRELYRGTSLGHIRSIEPDPENRFVLALTWETPQLIKFDIPGGQQTVLHDVTTISELGLFKQVEARQHATEGRMFILQMSPRWDSHVDLPTGVSEAIVVLKDPNNDGFFDAPVTLTPDEWSQQGYMAPGAFVDLCQ